MCIFCVKQKTAYYVRIIDWSSDVCSSDLAFAKGHERSVGRIERACPFCSLRAVDWLHRGGGAETLSVLRSLANVGGPGRVGQAAQTGLQQRRSTFETPSLERLYYWLEWRADLRRQYRPSSRGVGPLRGSKDRRALRGHPTNLWIRTTHAPALIEKV